MTSPTAPDRALSPRRHRAIHTIAATILMTIVLAACGGGDTAEDGLAGFVREPIPRVDRVALPDLSAGGDEFALRAPSGELLAVYFGFTNCPDICPATLSDLRSAIRRLPETDQDRISLAMISVDPDRDAPYLVDYTQTFVPGGHALLTGDQAVLRAAAEPFGVSYQVTIDDDGNVDVAHSTQLFLVDDSGSLLLTWQFGISADDIASDLAIMLERQSA
jgi:protein SCO1/2